MRRSANVGICIGTLAVTLVATPARAQYLGGGTKTAHEARMADLEAMGDKFVQLGRAFPAESFDWRPMEGVRSVRDVLTLVAAEANLFPTMWGFEAPEGVPDPNFGSELRRLGELDPAALVGEVERGFAHAHGLLVGLEPEEQERLVAFFGLEVPLGTAITLMGNDMHEHLGQLIAYARTHEIVPPWSRREGGP